MFSTTLQVRVVNVVVVVRWLRRGDLSRLTRISTKTHGWKRSWVFYSRPDPAQQMNMKTVKEEKPKAEGKIAGPPRAKSQIGQPMAGRDILVRALEREGVEYDFRLSGRGEHGNPSGADPLDHPHHPAPA